MSWICFFYEKLGVMITVDRSNPYSQTRHSVGALFPPTNSFAQPCTRSRLIIGQDYHYFRSTFRFTVPRSSSRDGTIGNATSGGEKKKYHEAGDRTVRALSPDPRSSRHPWSIESRAIRRAEKEGKEGIDRSPDLREGVGRKGGGKKKGGKVGEIGERVRRRCSRGDRKGRVFRARGTPDPWRVGT